MYQTYIGEKKSLVFPVMCDGYLSIEYRQGEVGTATSGSVIKQPEPHGLWDADSFTIETIMTPYDVNGYGWDLNSSSTLGDYGVDADYQTKKSFPQVETGGATNVEHLSQSNAYLSKAHRLDSTGSANDGYKMTLFWNENVELYLQNTTITNHNQPAEYQICFSVTIDSTTTTIRSGTAIDASEIHNGRSVESTLTNQKYTGATDRIQYDKLSTAVVSSGNPITTGSATFDLNAIDNTIVCHPGQELYANTSGQTFELIGVVDSVISGTVALKANAAVAVANPNVIYKATKREAPYLLNSYHVAAAFNKENGAMTIFLNGSELVTGIHTGTINDFIIYPDDCKIGQGSTSYSTTETIQSVSRTHIYYSQFFGELHEFAISNVYKTKFLSLDTLLPNHRNLVLYYRFEEIDL